MASVVISLIVFPLLVLTHAESKSYIVYMGGPLRGKTSLDIASLHQEKLASVLGVNLVRKSMLYSYKHIFHGFSAVLPSDKLEEISKLPGVISVMEDKLRRLETTHSMNFLGLRDRNGAVSNGPLDDSKAQGGQDVIIGMLDSGIWPKSKSFDDTYYGPIPGRWQGSCVSAPDFNSSESCNRKIIGAKFFIKGYLASNKTLDDSISYSPLDTDGHGTHTASTAAGSFVENANYNGLARGTASGAAYRARLAIYKICWGSQGTCADSDILSALDEGVADGCDVFSMSLSSPSPQRLIEDPIALGAFFSFLRGISVVLAAGNSGPFPGSIGNTAPWALVVGASTTDRVLESDVVLGSFSKYLGESLSVHELNSGFYPLVSAADVPVFNTSSLDSTYCLDDSLDPEKVEGKVVLCRDGVITDYQKGVNVRKAKGAGIIVYNTASRGETLLARDNVLPSTSVGAKAGLSILTYINKTKNPTAYITRPVTSLSTRPGPTLASFSSRDPNPLNPDILKPDIVAPGVNILAAFSQYKSKHGFAILSGTSMACPHVTGVVALLKSLHPGWSPAAIQSAIITTGKTTNTAGEPIIDDFSGKPAIPFGYGGGQIDPQAAADPGLVYDSTPGEYLAYFCRQINSTKGACLLKGRSELNYPSISVSLKNTNETSVITRRLTSVMQGQAKFRAKLELSGCPVSASVRPQVVSFRKQYEEARFWIEFNRREENGLEKMVEVFPRIGSFCYGSLTWSDDQHEVRSPIVVKLDD